MATLTIGAINGKNRPVAFRRMAAKNVDSFSTSEAGRPWSVRTLRSRRRYWYETADVVPPLTMPKARHRRLNTGVAVRRRFQYLGGLTIRVSEAVPGLERVAPDRYWTVALYAHPVARQVGCEGVAHVSIHPDAAPQAIIHGRKPGSPILREYEESVDSLVRMVKWLRRDGYLVVGGGDANITDRSDPHPWSPFLRLRRLGFVCDVHGIDFLFHDPRLVPAGPLRVTPKGKGRGRSGSDHPALRRTYKVSATASR